MNNVLENRASIYGLMAVWIMLFHIQGYAGVPLPFLSKYINYPLSYVIGLGNVGVDVFMFLSGYCLTLSYAKYKRVSDFYNKRFKRLLIPYILIATPFLIWKNCIAEDIDIISRFSGFISDLCGFSFIHTGMDWTWFIFAIFLLYAVFPLLYNMCKMGGGKSIILLVIVFIFIHLCYTYIPENIVSHRFAIAYCRIPIFLIGIMCAFYLSKIKNELYRPVICISLSILLYWGIYCFSKYYPVQYNNLFEGRMWLGFIPYVLPICYLSGWLFGKIPKLPLLNILGEISLEIYLIHILILNLFKHYHYNDILGGWCYLIIPVVTIILSISVQNITKILINESSSCSRF